MAKRKLKKFDIVEILWNDTHTPLESGWMSEEEHKDWSKEASCLVRSVGIVVSENDHFIELVGDCDADTDEACNFLRPINIAKGYIQSIRKLK